MEGIVMDIQKFCLQDGPGIRTTVFLKGCNMKCKWCHNPESMELEPVLMFQKEKCSRCGSCEGVCPGKVHSLAEGIHTIERQRCTACGACVKVCMNEALSITGEKMDSSRVMEEVEKDEKYYRSSGGGVTFSGGEATIQYEFLLDLLKESKKRGYHTALETNGFLSRKHLEGLHPYTDLFLLDYKITGEDHKKWTGASGEGVEKTLDFLQEKGCAVTLRCPVIPGINDNQMHFEAIRKKKEKYSCISKVEIMAYHSIGKMKWEQCGKQYSLGHIKTVKAEEKKLWEKEAAR